VPPTVSKLYSDIHIQNTNMLPSFLNLLSTRNYWALISPLKCMLITFLLPCNQRIISDDKISVSRSCWVSAWIFSGCYILSCSFTWM